MCQLDSSGKHTLNSTPGNARCYGKWSIHMASFQPQWSLRGRCLMWSYTWGIRPREISTARSAYTGWVAEPGFKPKSCCVQQSPGSSSVWLTRACGDEAWIHETDLQRSESWRRFQGWVKKAKRLNFVLSWATNFVVIYYSSNKNILPHHF